MIAFKSCPKCGDDMEWEADDDDWACIQCGRRVPLMSRLGVMITPIPPKPRAGPRILHRYYEANRARIIKEVEVLGEETARQRWGIAGGNWTRRKKRWGLPINKVGRPFLLPARLNTGTA